MRYLLILLFAFISSTTTHAEDTLFYSRVEEVTFDTIPYMVRDEYFIKAYNELSLMFDGEKSYSLKRAEFLVEWAYLGGRNDYGAFCHDIDSIVGILRRFIEANEVGQYKTAPNFALFEYFTKSSPMNGNKAFTYDFDDFTGIDDFSKLFVTKVMKTHTGQCTSLPLYYKILCDELGGQSSLALAPMHMYVKHIGEDGKWVNIELTNGHFVRDEWMIQTMNVSTEAIRNGIFLTALSEKENIGLMLILLAKAYKQKYGGWDFFTLKCANKVLEKCSHFCDALVVKYNIHQSFGISYIQKYGYTISDFKLWNDKNFIETLELLDKLGYSQQSQEEYKRSVAKAINGEK